MDTPKLSTTSKRISEQKMKWTGTFVNSMQGMLPRALRGSESAGPNSSEKSVLFC